MLIEYSCASCYRGHGLAQGFGLWTPNFVSSLSASYCFVESPTLDLGGFLTSLEGVLPFPTHNIDYSDYLGTQTAVSAYFTTTSIGNAVTITQTAIYADGSSQTAPTTTISTPFASAGGVTSANASSPTDNGLSQGVLIGIAVGAGVAVVFLIVALAGFFLYRRRKQRYAANSTQPPSYRSRGNTYSETPVPLQNMTPEDPNMNDSDNFVDAKELPAPVPMSELPGHVPLEEMP